MTQDEKVELVARAMLADELKATNSRRDFDEEWEREKLVWTQNARAAIAALEALPVEEPTTGDAVRDQLERMGSDTRYSDEFFGNFVRSRLSDILAALAQSQPTPDKDEAVI